MSSEHESAGDDFGDVCDRSRVRLVAGPDADADDWVWGHDSLGRRVRIPRAIQLHQRHWEQFQARESVDSRAYSPMRPLWEINGRLS